MRFPRAHVRCGVWGMQISTRQTLLVNARRSISNAMGVWVTSGMYAISLAFTRHMQDCCSARYGTDGLIGLDFGHFPSNQIAGKWQPDAGLIAGAWEAKSFRDVYLPSRLPRISRRRLPALAWSAKGRFLNGQSRVGMNSFNCFRSVSNERG
jgi:hypothetical protein